MKKYYKAVSSKYYPDGALKWRISVITKKKNEKYCCGYAAAFGLPCGKDTCLVPDCKINIGKSIIEEKKDV